VAYRRLHPLPRFLDGPVAQPDDREGRQAGILYRAASLISRLDGNRASVPDDRRSERAAAEDALVGRFVALVMPGAPWRPLLPRNGLPPDYLVGRAGDEIGIELTEVLLERVPDDIPVLTVTGPRRASDPGLSNETLNQNRARRQVEQTAEKLYAGPAAIVRPSWSSWKPVRDADIQRLASALADAVAGITVGESTSGVMLGWEELERTPLAGYIDRVRVDSGGWITQPMWASNLALWEVSADAIQRTIQRKEALFGGWRESVRERWLLLTLSPESERLLDSASEHTYTAAFDAVHCCDARGVVPLSVQPHG
jgi:hypothetical protein